MGLRSLLVPHVDAAADINHRPYRQGHDAPPRFDADAAKSELKLHRLTPSQIREAASDKRKKAVIDEATEAGLFLAPQDVDNIHAMNDEKFQAYLDKVRKMRPEFKQFLAAGEAVFSSRNEPRSIYQFSQTFPGIRRSFLSAQTHQRYNAEDSQIIQPQPHLNGGLSYTAVSPLQKLHWRFPQPGRLIRFDSGSGRAIIAFAGMTMACNKPPLEQRPVNFKGLAITRSHEHSDVVFKYKMINSELLHAPSVVGTRPPKMEAITIASELQDADAVNFTGNPHRPGSKEYLLHEVESRTQQDRILQRPKRQFSVPTVNATPEEMGTYAENTMGVLESLVQKDG